MKFPIPEVRKKNGIKLDDLKQSKVCVERPEGKLCGFCKEERERN